TKRVIFMERFHKSVVVKIRNALRDFVVKLNLFLLRYAYKISIGQDTIISWKAQLDRTNPQGLDIGNSCYIAADALVLSHDYINKKHVKTIVGNNVFVGAKAIILPGITI